MKRILLYYDSYCGEKSHGGTEVATSRIAKALKATGDFEVFNACKRRRDFSTEEIYSKVEILPRDTFICDLALFIRENNIDAVVNMGRFYRHPKLKKAIAQSGRKTKLFFMHHFAPDSESVKHTYTAGWHLLQMNPANPKYWVRATFYPVFKLQRRLCLGKMYRKIIEECDGVILLSEGYKGQYLKKAYGKDLQSAAKVAGKLTAIPNIFNLPATSEAPRKEKRVLILSRMDEIQKRISIALEIWKKIEGQQELKDWSLDIVGTGDDMEAIRKRASSLGLKRVVFHGWQSGEPFLEKSDILLSTSLYEGLPLSMLEAQAYGCVPIAFDSYASLRDVVKDGVNGIVVEEFGDTNTFAQKLASLMKNDEFRKSLADKGKETAKKYSSIHIASLWKDFLQKHL